MHMPPNRLFGLKLQSLLEIGKEITCSWHGMPRKVVAVDWVDDNGLFIIHQNRERTDSSEGRNLLGDPTFRIDQLAIEIEFEKLPEAAAAFDHLTGIKDLKELYLNYSLKRNSFKEGSIYAATVFVGESRIPDPVQATVQVVCLEVYDPPFVRPVYGHELGNLCHALFADLSEKLWYSDELMSLTLVVDSHAETPFNN